MWYHITTSVHGERLSVRSLSGTQFPRAKSRVSNGSALFVAGDARSAWGRRYRDIFEAHVSDLGGIDLLSEAQLQLCRRAASLALESERLEGRLAEGDATVDIDLLGRLAGHLGRAYDRLGVKRVARDTTLDLQSYLAAKASAEAADA
jgi:hypothetical protein